MKTHHFKTSFFKASFFKASFFKVSFFAILGGFIFTPQYINAQANMPEHVNGEQYNFDMKNPRHAIAGVMTGGQPSQADLAQLKEHNYGTIINLRRDGEFNGYDEPDAVADMGMNYIHIPIAGAGDLTMENVLKLDRALKQADGKVLLHCGSGNRVGALLALKAYHVDGLSADAAMELGIAAGMTRLAPAVQSLLEAPRQ